MAASEKDDTPAKTSVRPRKAGVAKPAAAKTGGATAATKVAAAKQAGARPLGSAPVKPTPPSRPAVVAPKVPAKPAAKARATPKAAAAANAKGGAGTMLGVAAVGLAAGLVANLGRKAAIQAPSVMAGDWFEALKLEHKAALALLDQIAKTTDTQTAKRSMLLMQLKHALGKHAFTEENVIYPALREWGDKADADALNHEQGYHKQFLYELDGMDKASSEFVIKCADFRADLNAHINEEEEKIFPQFHAALSAEKNKALTAMANKEGFKLA
jgi:hemerythrin superfamily protein